MSHFDLAVYIESSLTKYKKLRESGDMSEEQYETKKDELFALPEGWVPKTTPSNDASIAEAIRDTEQNRVATLHDPDLAMARNLLEVRLPMYLKKYGDKASQASRDKAIKTMVSTFALKAKEGELNTSMASAVSPSIYGDVVLQLLQADLLLNPVHDGIKVYNTYIIQGLIEKFPEDTFAAYSTRYVHLKVPLFPPVEALIPANKALLEDVDSYILPHSSPTGGSLLFPPQHDNRKLPKCFAKGHAIPPVVGGAYWVPVQETPQGPAVDMHELQELGEFVAAIDSNTSSYCSGNDTRLTNLEKMVVDAGITTEKGKPIKEAIEELRKRSVATKRALNDLRDKVKNTQWLQSMMAGQSNHHGTRRSRRQGQGKF